jgi:predicted transcriptional regulator
MLSKLEEELDLIQRHVNILKLVIKNEPLGIIKLSEMSGIAQHKVRYSLRILEQQGIIRPSPQGAITTRKAKKFLETYPKKLKELSNKMMEMYKALKG